MIRNTRKAALIGALTASVLLTGCFDYESRTEIAADGSGSLTLSIKVDTERAAGLTSGMTGGDVSAQTPVQSPQEVCAEFFSDTDTAGREGIELDVTNEPDDCSLTATVRWQAGESAQEKLDLLASMSQEEGEPAGQSPVRLTGSVEEGWNFTFNVANLQDSDTGSGEGPDAGADEAADMLMRAIGMAAFEGKTLRVSVKLPGSVVDHNGVLDGNTVSWELPMYEAMTSAQEEFRATSVPGEPVTVDDEVTTAAPEEPGAETPESRTDMSTTTTEVAEESGSTNPLVWIGGAIAVLALAAGAFFIGRRR